MTVYMSFGHSTQLAKYFLYHKWCMALNGVLITIYTPSLVSVHSSRFHTLFILMFIRHLPIINACINARMGRGTKWTLISA